LKISQAAFAFIVTKAMQANSSPFIVFMRIKF